MMRKSPIQRITAIFKKEIQLDFKDKHIVYALFLYALTNVFIATKVFIDIRPMIWNSLFVLIFLFVALNSILKSFAGNFNNRHLFYYSLYNPFELLIGKILYNFLFLLVISALIVLSLLFFSEVQIANWGLLLSSISLAALGFSVCFSFIGLLSIKSGNSSTVFSILAIPLVMPILLLMVKINATTLGLIIDTSVNQDVLMLFAVDLMFMSVSLLLFPLLWKE